MNKNYAPPGLDGGEDTIAVDFDGVIHNDNKGYHDGTCYGNPISGSIPAIIKLSKKYKIVIHTAKAKADRPLVNGKTGKELVWDWLEKYDLKEFIFDVTAEKPRAKIYIDNKAYKFEDNWNDITNML